MAAPSSGEFEKWLSEKLLEINPEVDLDVFVTYIISILEAESTEDEQKEDLFGFIAEIAEDADVESHCDEILKKWQMTCGAERLSDSKPIDNDTVIDKFHSIVEKQQSQKVSGRELSAEEKARKSAILAQYGHISDGEVTDEEVDLGEIGMSVAEREQELRERMKQEHENKKLKDKEDRERQKQKAAERKVAEKKRTQKSEHRR